MDWAMWLAPAGVVGGCIALVRVVLSSLLRQIADYRRAYEAEQERNDALQSQLLEIVSTAQRRLRASRSTELR